MSLWWPLLFICTKIIKCYHQIKYAKKRIINLSRISFFSQSKFVDQWLKRSIFTIHHWLFIWNERMDKIIITLNPFRWSRKSNATKLSDWNEFRPRNENNLNQVFLLLQIMYPSWSEKVKWYSKLLFVDFAFLLKFPSSLYVHLNAFWASFQSR